MFLVNHHPVVVLFDLGSLHSFVSKAFTVKHGMSISELDVGYCISSAGANISTKQAVRDVRILIHQRQRPAEHVPVPQASKA